MTPRDCFILAIAAVLAGIVACVVFAAASAQPVPRVYLPVVAREVPPMSAEYTPAVPVATVTPEVQP